MRTWLTAVPLVAAWLLAVLGARISALTGLYPGLVAGNLMLWTVLTGLGFRYALAGYEPWRKCLPVAVLLASVAFHQYALRTAQAHHTQTQGAPRRYYTWDPEK